ncbi:hypothetical protein HZ326_21164 [Fusarium oxysporum f. sp. albedinis]|nr:hypothetical protein HZ326_21164 [Fusarium oxysporum f. sp. albedinis]
MRQLFGLSSNFQNLSCRSDSATFIDWAIIRPSQSDGRVWRMPGWIAQHSLHDKSLQVSILSLCFSLILQCHL